MFQRRSAPLQSQRLSAGDHSSPPRASAASAVSALPLRQPPTSAVRRKKTVPSRRSLDLVVVLFLVLALLLTLAAYCLPTQEKQAVAHLERAAEEEIAHLWHEFHDAHGAVPPIPQDQHEQLSSLSSERSSESTYSWVAGEQKLKQALKVLADRQVRGLDLGVPVLTRWLGEDLPAWPDGTISREEWQLEVDERYAKMQQEETLWRKRMGELLQASPRG
jgi:hypothetical protein